MARQTINVGAAPNDGTGDTWRDGFIKANTNFAELYATAPTNQAKVYTYASDSSAGSSSMLHAPQGALVVDDVVMTYWYDTNKRASSYGRYRVVAVNGTQNTSNVGNLANGGSLGLLLEGAWYRFAYDPYDGITYPLRPLGFACVAGVTGWHSRYNTLADYMKAQGPTSGARVVGGGYLTCTETVYHNRVRCSYMPVFVAQDNFFSAAQANTAVTVAQGATSSDPVVVTFANHGFAAGKEVMFGTTGRIPGNINTMTRYFVFNPTTDTFQLSTSNSTPVSIKSSTAGSVGTHYCFYSPVTNNLPSQSNVVTEDYLRWDGKIKRLGIVVRSGTDDDNRFWMDTNLEVWGDGDLSLTTKVFNKQPTTVCVRHENDDSANAQYRYVTNLGYVGCSISGPAEKNKITVSGIKCRWLTYVPNQASCDTLELEIHGNDCQAWYGEHEGIGTSPKLKLAVESRSDPARDTSSDSEGYDAPAMLIRNGKATTLSGFIRANNGMRGIVVYGKLNQLGNVLRTGADFLHFDDFRIIHGYGIALDIRSVMYADGNVVIRNWRDPFRHDTGSSDEIAYTNMGISPVPAPCVMLGRISNATGLRITGYGIENDKGLVVGYKNDSTVAYLQGPQADNLNYFPVNADLGKVAMVMGTGLAFANDPTFTESSGKGITETLTAWDLNWMKDTKIDLSGSKGNGFIRSLVSGVSTAVVGREFLTVGNPTSKKYSISKSAAAVCDVGIPTLNTAGITLNTI